MAWTYFALCMHLYIRDSLIFLWAHVALSMDHYTPCTQHTCMQTPFLNVKMIFGGTRHRDLLNKYISLNVINLSDSYYLTPHPTIICIERSREQKKNDFVTLFLSYRQSITWSPKFFLYITWLSLENILLCTNKIWNYDLQSHPE